jgi:hypothetical protein
MLKFLSRKETAPLRDKLIPYGWSRETKHFHDDLAWSEQERARIDGRGFGRRASAPERQRILKRKVPADRVAVFARDSERETLVRHPGSLFRR